MLLRGLTRSASRGRVMVCGHSSSPGPLTGRSQRKRCALLVSFTLHDSCHPGHEGTAKFSTDQGKVAHPVSQFRMRFRYSNCYRFTERVQWSEDPSMGEISLMIWWSFHQTKGVWFPRRVLGSPGEQPKTPWTLFRESAVGGIDLCVTPHRLRALDFQ